MSQRLLIVFVSLLACQFLSAQTKSTVKEYTKIFPTYPYSDPDPVPDFGKIYPYFRFDGFTDKPVQKEWKVVELENDFIKVMILPEIGGKIWAAIEKSTNRPFIYYNHSVKFRDVAMRGPWTSGGIEANYGIIGHTPNSASPVDYLVKQKEDGSSSCYIGWLDLLTRTNWSIEINLPADKAYFTTHSTWYNNTGTEQPYYHWMNVGIKTSGNLQFIYPGNKYIGHEGEHADWPVNRSNNKHIDFYEQNNFGGYKSYHVFGKYTDFFGAYWHKDDFGMARYSPHDEKAGKKIWIWGLSQQGMIWEKLLTDTDGQYAEIQSGRLFNQNSEGSSLTPFKHISFEPYATDEWTEYWYPVLRTKGFVKANEWGALNTRIEDGWLKVDFSPAQAINDELQIRTNGVLLYHKLLRLSPLKTFSDSVRLASDPANMIVTLGAGKLLYNASPDADLLGRPVDAPRDFNWKTAYGQYIAGKEFLDQRLYTRAEEKLEQSLKLDSNFLPSLTKRAALYYHNMEYTKGLYLVKRALSIDTHDGEANYYYGLINEALENLTDAKDGFDLASLLPAYRAAAYTALSKIYLKEGNYEKANNYADKALYYNAGNITAYKLKAIIFRHLNDKDKAAAALAAVEKLDPLNHFSLFERWRWTNDPGDKAIFTGGIRNELVYQTFLELSMDYYNLGLLTEAVEMLDAAPAQALISYWKGYLHFKSGTAFDSFIKEGDESNPAFVLPFRAESEAMLKWLLTKTSSWKPRYYLSLLYHDRNRIEESRNLMLEIGDQPAESFFYAARAAWQDNDADKEKDLLKANSIDRNEWRYIKKLAEFCLDKQQEEKALALIAPFYKTHRSNYIIGMTYAKTLLATNHYAEAGKLLATLQVIPFEGATDGRELYRQAMLLQAVQSLHAKKFSNALKDISKAKEFPDNLGSGKPYPDDIDTRMEDYLSALYYQKTNHPLEAAQLFQAIADYPASKPGTKINIVIQAWALKKINKEQAAKELVTSKLDPHQDEQLINFVTGSTTISPERNSVDKKLFPGKQLLAAISGIDQ